MPTVTEIAEGAPIEGAPNLMPTINCHKLCDSLLENKFTALSLSFSFKGEKTQLPFSLKGKSERAW